MSSLLMKVKIVKYLLGLIGLTVYLMACPAKEETSTYSFFVAGHTYGVLQKQVPGLHMPFVADFNYLNASEKMSFGVLTGDIVYHSRDTSWDHVDRQLADLKMPVYFTTGNHDEGHKSPYKDRYGRTYYAFEEGRDLHVVLNPGLAGWNIWNDQLDFFHAQMQKAEQFDHLFLYFHHVLWWEDDNQYATFPPNSLDGRAPEINFWPEVMPVLQSCGRPVYCFAGDVGARGLPTVFFADKVENVHLIASGMGNGTKDNYLLVEVNAEGEVEVKIRWLQGGMEEVVFTEERQLPFGISWSR